MCVRGWGGEGGWFDEVGVGGRTLRNDLTQRCSINPIHNCFSTWCAVLLHEGAKPRVSSVSGERQLMNYLLKISQRAAFHVNDEPNAALGASVCRWTYFQPRGNLSFYQMS